MDGLMGAAQTAVGKPPPDTIPPWHAADGREHRTRSPKQECRYLVKDSGTSQFPKSTRQRDSRYCPDRPALITTPSRTLQQS
ncbi:MAG: hypothetical protein G8D58_10635, partial [gamma proteobacterium symbiont of Phacoides pectinatus]